jgi:hypothetical protein
VSFYETNVRLCILYRVTFSGRVMINKRVVLRQLKRLSDPKTDGLRYEDYMLLGEVIREVFPAGHPIGSEYATLEVRKTRRAAQKDQPDKETMAAEAKLSAADQKKVQSLAETTLSLIEGLDLRIPAGPRDPDERAIQRMVDQSFHESRAFTATKWILAIALTFIGLGSFSFLGISVDIWRRVSSAYEQVGNIEKDASQKMQQAASDASQKIKDKTTEIVTRLDADKSADQRIQQAAMDIEGRLKGHETELTKQLDTRKITLDQNITKEQDKITALAGSIADQDKRIGALVGRIDGLEKNLSRILEVETKIASGTTSGDLQLIGAVLERSAECLIIGFAIALAAFLLSALALYRTWRGSRVHVATKTE